jgi:hypothetical protein
MAQRDPPPGDQARQGIGGEGVPRAAPKIARELVEQQDERQRPLRRPRPTFMLAPRGGVMRRLEPLADLRIERRALGEPSLRPRLTPEADDV